MISEVSPTATVVLDGSGNGQCSLGPPSGTKWALRLATTATSTASKQPQAKLYRGSATGPLQLLDNTYTGSAASSAKVGGAIYYPGQLLWAVWSGGDAGATATLQAFGQQGNRSDPLPLSPPGEGFANPVVSQLIAGTPGGAEIVINATPVPTNLAAYYTTGNNLTVTAPERLIGVILRYDTTGVKYTYEAMAIDSSATPVVSPVSGAFDGATVTEYTRFTNFGSGAFRTFFQANIIQAQTGGVTDPTLTVFATSTHGDVDDRCRISAGGKYSAGPGNIAPDTTQYRDSAGVWGMDDIRWNNAGAGETWHAVTLLNGWTNFGGGNPAMRYRRVASPANCVQLAGLIAPGTKTNGTTIFTLPAGYRPTNQIIVPVVPDNTAAPAVGPNIAIQTNGNVNIGSCTTTASFLSIHALIPLDA